MKIFDSSNGQSSGFQGSNVSKPTAILFFSAAQICKAPSLDLAKEHPALELDIGHLQFNAVI